MTGSHRAFVIGATGYTGRAVVSALRQRGVETFAHVRPDSSRLDAYRDVFAGAGATVDTTPWEAPAFHARMQEVAPTLVFGLLGITASSAKREAAQTGQPRATYRSVDYALTVLAAEASAQLTPRPRFVYLSSLGADSPRGNAYLQARADTEAALRTLELPFTIVRPSFITGDDRDEDRPGERIGAAVADAGLGLLAALGAKRLRDRYRSRTNDELAASLVRVALDPSMANRVVEAQDL